MRWCVTNLRCVAGLIGAGGDRRVAFAGVRCPAADRGAGHRHQLIDVAAGVGRSPPVRRRRVSVPARSGPRIAAIMVCLCVGGVPVQGPDRGVVGGAVWHRGLGGHGRSDDHPRRRWAERVPGAGSGTDRRRRRGAVRRDRAESVEGKLAWVHSATKYALITVHARRGIEAMNAAGMLPSFSGIACRDA